MTQRDMSSGHETELGTGGGSIHLPDEDRTAASKRHGGGVLASAVLAQLMLMVTLTIMLIALPSIQTALHVSDTDRTWVVTAYTLPFGALMLFGGKLSQRLGVRRAFLVAVIGFAVASLLGGVAPTFTVLIAARAIQGVFAALMAPTNLSLISTSFSEPRARGRAFAILGSTGGAGAALGLVLGGTLTQSLNWRWCFFVVVILALVAVVLALRSLAGIGGESASGALTADLGGLLLGCAGLFSLIYGLSEAERHDWGSTATLSFLIGGGILLAIFIVRERFATNPVLPLWIVRDATRASSNLIMLFSGCAQLGSLVYLTYYFQENLHYTAVTTGLKILPLVGALVVASFVAPSILVPRIGTRIVFPLGTLVQSGGFFILATLNPDSTYVSHALPALIVIGAGMGLVLPSAFSAGTHDIPVSHSGVASALLNSAQQLGASFGVAYLSTYATHAIATTLRTSAAGIKAEIAHALSLAGTSPQTAQGLQIVNAITLRHEGAAAIAAYAGGFQVVAWLGVVAAVLLIVIALAQRFAAVREN